MTTYKKTRTEINQKYNSGINLESITLNEIISLIFVNNV